MKAKQKMIKQKQNAVIKLISSSSCQTNNSNSLHSFHHNLHNKQTKTFESIIDKQNIEPNLNSNVINIQNYSGKKFITDQGFAPMMIQSCYQSKQIVKEKQCVERQPITFGGIKKDIRKNMIQSNRNIQTQYQVNGRKSSEGGLDWKKFRNLQNFEGEGGRDVKCVNHQMKKAKYKLCRKDYESGRSNRLLSQSNKTGQPEILFYCSKCAILLLQKGEKVEEISKSCSTSKLIRNHQHTLSGSNLLNSQTRRVTDLKRLQKDLQRWYKQTNKNIQNLNYRMQEIRSVYDRKTWYNTNIYDYLIDCLCQMKKQEVQNIKNQKQDILREYEEEEKKQTLYLQDIAEVRREVVDYPHKFVTMSEKQFQNIVYKYSETASKHRQVDSGSKLCAHEISVNNSDEPQQKISTILKILTIYARQLSQSLQGGKQNQIESSPSSIRCSNNFHDQRNSQTKNAFRTLFPDSGIKYEDPHQFSLNNIFRENGRAVDLYHNNENQSPSFQKNERPQAYKNYQ